MSSISDSTLLAAARNVLVATGFQEVDVSKSKEIDPTRTRLFEDPYSLVLVAAFQSAAELIDAWPRVQSALAALITRTIDRNDAKAWDGYLVLLLGRPPVRDDLATLSKIAYDTRRVRKIIVTPDMIGADLDLTNALLPVLPLPVLPSLGTHTSMEQVLESMEESLGTRAKLGLQALFEASRQNTSPLTALENLVRNLSDEEQN
ncbi:MAG: hypothetical protein JWQ12_1761 [Glaciihabitans sp.]|nr:hypothetical protein [Glaciihabitans sp.]